MIRIDHVGSEIGDHVLAEAGIVDAVRRGRIDRREHEGIGAAASREPVVSGSADQRVVAAIADESVVPLPPVMVFARPLPVPVKLPVSGVCQILDVGRQASSWTAWSSPSSSCCRPPR